MDNFNLNLFKYFYYVVLYNGVTNASKNLSVAQPSLSLSIKNLESQLNKDLIDRSNKQFTLTDSGEQLFNFLKPIFESIEQTIYFPNNKAEKFIELKVGIRYSYAKSLLLDFIQYFKLNNSKIKLNIDLYSKLDFSKVKNREYDIIIDDNEYIKQLENVEIKKLLELNNYFICGGELYNEYKDIISISDMDGLPFISYRPSLKTGKFRQLCYQNNVGFLELMNVNESEVYFELIKNNVGIGFSNEILLKNYVSNNSIKIIKVKEEIFKDIISIAYTNNDPVTKNFVEILIKYINEVK